MLGFAFLAAIVLLVSALSLRSLGGSNDRFANYQAGVGTRERLATGVRGAATNRAIAARNLVLVTEAKDVELEKAHDIVGKAQAGPGASLLRSFWARSREYPARAAGRVSGPTQPRARWPVSAGPASPCGA
jgi:hypothetical protein